MLELLAGFLTIRAVRDTLRVAFSSIERRRCQPTTWLVDPVKFSLEKERKGIQEPGIQEPGARSQEPKIEADKTLYCQLKCVFGTRPYHRTVPVAGLTNAHTLLPPPALLG